MGSYDFVDLLRTLLDHWWSEFTDLGEWPGGTFESIAEYIDLYPLVVSLLWCVYGVNALLRSFRNAPAISASALPSYTVVIPFYGEPEGAIRSAISVGQAFPPPDEILLVDDGSPEGHGTDAIDLSQLPPRARLLRLEANGGKAAALNVALREVRSELLLCLDADTLLHTPNLEPMLAKFVNDPSMGAVTGRLWPTETRSLCSLMQALDYLAVIGLVKNAEQQWGGLMTVSGAFVAVRRAALEEVGGWNESTAAEDIDLSWRLQGAAWKLGYARRCTAKVEMVPTWHGLWRQRRRWSRGLGHTMRQQALGAFRPGASHLPIFLLTFLGASWLWAALAIGAVRLVRLAVTAAVGQPSNHAGTLNHLLIYLGLGFAFFLGQVLIAALLDRARPKLYPLLFLISFLYPVYFWAFSVSTFLVGFPQGFLLHDAGRWRRTQRSAELEAAKSC